MKPIILFAFAVGVAASPLSLRDDPRAAEGHLVLPGGIAPALQDLKPRLTDYAPGSKRVKVRYGPYQLPSVKEPSMMAKMTGEQGTMMGLGFNLAKPCSGSCNILSAQAGLEYADGRVADTADGAWLHHIVLILGGTGRKDATCGLMPGERIFSSGNERTPIAFSDSAHNKIKSAMPLRASDQFHMQYELMNMIDTPQSVYVTIEFDYLPGELPADWKQTKALWYDVTNCPGLAFIPPPKGKTKFTLPSKAWPSTWDAQMLSVGGHVHDGGINVNIYQNDKVICDSRATYAGAKMNGNGTSGGMTGMAGMRRAVAHGPDAADGKDHIDKMSVCTELGSIKKGDLMRIEANYDFDKYEGMKSPQGNYVMVMGISIMYVAIDR